MRRVKHFAGSLLAAVGLSLVVGVSAFFAPFAPLAPQRALAANGLTVTKSVDGNPLIGGQTVYTITVANNSFAAGAQNPDGKAYNLDITDALPPGVRFVSATGPNGSASPSVATSGSGATQVQTLTFANLADVARNQTISLTIVATLNPNVVTPGTMLANTGSAKVANDPRAAASIDAGNANANSTALPFKLTKKAVQSTGVSQDTGGCLSVGAPGAGREYSYDLIATNNGIGPSSGMTITDTLPNGVEYCGTSDGGVTPTVTNNPNGTTTLVYALGTLAANQVKTVSPHVAIRYTYQVGGLIPDDTQMINTANLTGTYAAVMYDTGNQTATVKAKYATIAKASDKGTVSYGDVITYTLTPSTSTNYAISNEYVIDTLPDGQEYNAGSAKIGATAFAPTDAAQTDGIYSPCAGATKPAAGVYVCPDGTTVLTWGKINDAALTPTGPGTQYTIAFTATVGQKYKHGTGQPILATDSFTNSAKVVYDAASIAANMPANSVVRHEDTATAPQGTNPPIIEKRVVAVTRADGSATPAGEGRVIDPKNSTAAVGDITTFRVTYTGSTSADQKDIVVADFLPTNFTYVAGSAMYSGTYISSGGMISADTSATPGARLAWTLTGGNVASITSRNQTFIVEFRAQSQGGNAGDGNTNLAKFSGVNTAALAYSGRDLTGTITLAPRLALTKTNSSTPPVQGNSEFSYTVKVRNTGNSTAYQITDLVDQLPADIQYLGTASVTPAGAFTGPAAASGFGDTITFTKAANLSLAPGAEIVVVYNVKVKPNPLTGSVDANNAVIASYVSQPTGPLKTYGPVQASTYITIGSGTIQKSGQVHTPQVNETAGKALTVGDRVDYTLEFTLPPDQTFADGTITDCLPTGFRYTPGSYSATTSRPLPGPGALPMNDASPGFTTTAGSGSPCAANRDYVTVNFGTQANAAPNSPTTPIVITVKLSATITGTDRTGATTFAAVPSSQSEKNNAYAFTGTTPQGTAESPAFTVNRPNLVLKKTLFSPTTPTVKGGTNIDFLVTLENNGGSPAYDVAPLVDTLDPGLSFAGAFLSNAMCATTTAYPGAGASGQVVTLPVPNNTLAANTTLYVCIRAMIAPPAAPSSVYKNGVTLGTGAGPKYHSAPVGFPSRASYTQDANPQAQVTTPDATVLKGEKSGRPNPDGKATPGETITFTLQFTIPRGTVLYNPTVTDNYNFAQMNPQFVNPTDTTSGRPSLNCTNGASSAYSFGVAAGVATYTFAGNLAATGGGDAVCNLQYDVKVANIKPQNVAGATATNPSFTLAFKDNKGAGVMPVTSNPASVTIVEPNVTIAKTLATNWGPDGRAIFNVTITNASGPNVSVASDITITDNLPVGLIFVRSTNSGDAVNPSMTHAGFPPVLNGNNLTFKADSLAPGKSHTFAITVVSDLIPPQAPTNPPPGTVLINTANLKYYDLPASINGNNNQGDPTSRREYTGTASAPITVPPALNRLGFQWAFVQYTDKECINPGTSIDVYARIVSPNADIVDSPRLTYLKPNEAASSAGSFANFTRVSGDRRDGIYKATISLDQYSPSGVYKIKELYAYDTMNGQVRQDINDAVSVSSAVTVCGGGNTGGGGSCQMSNMTYIVPMWTTPTSVIYPGNAGYVQPGGSVTVTARLTSCSGIIDPHIEYAKPDGSPGPRAELALASGTPNDGIWRGTVLFDQYSPAGTYKVKELYGFDMYNAARVQSLTEPASPVAASPNVLVGTPAPTITGISPTSGPVSGGTLVTITGSGFREGATVRFGTATGVDAHAFDGGSWLTVLTPALSTGVVAVVVTNPDGQSTGGSITGNEVRGASASAPVNFTAVQVAAVARPTTPPQPTSVTGGTAPNAAPATRAAATQPSGIAPSGGSPATPQPTPNAAPMRR